jgi:hypothetical protein
MASYKDHRLAELFPLLSQPKLREMAEDIREKGLLLPITLYEGKILDGRNRYRACNMAGVEPRFEEYTGDDPLGFVVSLNLPRRHLNESQRATIAAKLATMPQGGDRKSEKAKSVEASPPKTVKEAARLMNVSPRSVHTAKEILREAPPEAVTAIERGERTVTEVAREVKAKKEQDAAPPLLDKTGFPVPEKILADWHHAESFKPLLGQLSQIKATIDRGLKDQDLAFRELSNTLVADLQSCYAQIKQLIPYAVCPTCQGQTRSRCALCKERGYLSEFAWKQYVPEEAKELRRRMKAA